MGPRGALQWVRLRIAVALRKLLVLLPLANRRLLRN